MRLEREAVLVRDELCRLLARRLPRGAVRAARAADPSAQEGAAAAPYDPSLWRELSSLGLAGAALPERDGGAGLSPSAAVAIAEALGRAAAPCSLLSTLVSGGLARELSARSDGEPARALARRIAGGAAVTIAGASGAEGTPGFDALSSRDGALFGVARFVADAPEADVLVALARAEDGPVIVAVERDAPGLTIHEERLTDLTRRAGAVHLDGARGLVLASGAVALAAWAAARPWVWTLASADVVGACEWLLATTVEHAKTREQFGRPIGVYQAVKHQLVAMMSELDLARSLVYAAAATLGTDPRDSEIAARAAKAQASEAARLCAGRAVQLHGGIGFTWECDVHLWAKRAIHGQLSYGDAASHRRELARLWLDAPDPDRRAG
ncbi:MAG: acyl-CoA dehydrogenase family protein [Polyangiaceae bacterium]|nr:acyl-CoA dehydrogenase family protein [Polyangiaceae bacterium]